MRLLIFIAGLHLAVVIISPSARADRDPMAKMLGRTTSAAAIDLSRSLIKQKKYAQAKSFCQWQRQRFTDDDEEHAKWTVEFAKVLIAEKITDSQFNESAVRAATAPLDDWLRVHPDHPHRVFVEHARLEVRQRASEVMVAVAAISRHDTDRIENALARLVRLRLDHGKLARRVKDMIAGLETLRKPGQKQLLNDLKIARQKILVAKVGLAMMETELFASGSDDQIAAAADAEKQADQTIIELGASAGAILEVYRLRIQSLILQGRLVDAQKGLDEVTKHFAITRSGDWAALQAELMLADQQPRKAKATLAGVTEVTVGTSLAKLKLLLTTNQLDKAAKWMDEIEQKHGLYARRRAEVITLDHGMSSGTPAGGNGLLANQAKQMIREGDHQAAAVLLSRIAQQTQDSKEAIQHAITAAAAFRAANQMESAAKILIEVAQLHPDSEAAGKLHLQGLLLASTPPISDSSFGPSRLIDSLQFHLSTWKSSDSFLPARDWLVRLRQARGDHLQAAQVQTRTSSMLIDQAWPTKTYQVWRQAMKAAKPDEMAAISRAAFESLAENPDKLPAISETLEQVTTLLLEPTELTRLHTSTNGRSATASLASWRRGNDHLVQAAIDDARSLPEDQLKDLRWRLFRDGNLDRSKRDRIARFLAAVQPATEPPLETARLLLWNGATEQGMNVIKKFVDKNQDGENLIDAAKLLEQHDTQNAKLAAIDLWDRLAQGVPTYSETWHLAKWSAIKVLHDMGNKNEASKRASYLLLTNPKMGPTRKARYERFR